MNNQRTMKPIDVLLVEDNPGDVRRIKKSMAQAGKEKFDLTCVGQLFDTIKSLDEEDHDIVMLNPSLPDSQGFNTFISVRMHAPQVPIILLSDSGSDDLAVKALQNGAQDCLDKGQLKGGILSRSIRYAIERHRIMADLEHTREKEHRMAYFDALTELPNRQLFYDRLNQAFSQAQRYGQKLGLLFVDLDGFKRVNDSLGHNCGDLLLQAVAQRLKDCLRKSDTVARMGGDEFTCILPNIKKSKDVTIVAQKIIRTLARPFAIDGHKISISGSIGASLYPDDAGELQLLIKNADMAMYHAKRQGKNNCQFFARNKNAIIRESYERGVLYKTHWNTGASSISADRGAFSHGIR